MTRLRYPFSAVFTDYAIGLSGTVIAAVMTVTTGWSGHLFWPFLALTVCCLAYTIRTVLQHRTIFEIDETGISRLLMGRIRRIEWNEITRLSLRYYPRRRAKKKGMGSVLGRIGRRGFEDDRASHETRPSSPLDDGWLVLKLRGAAGQHMTLESGLPDFFRLTERAAAAARDKGVEIDPVSDDNLRALASLPPEFRAAASAEAPAGTPTFRRNI